MVDLAILAILSLCVLAGYYRGTIYAAINVGLTVVSFFLALLLIPAASGIIKNSESLYHGLLYYFEGYEYVSTTSVERVHDVVTAVDDGTIPNAWGSINFDDEGTPSHRNVLIENGILKSYMIDKFGGRRMGMAPTGNARRESYAYVTTSRMTATTISSPPWISVFMRKPWAAAR